MSLDQSSIFPHWSGGMRPRNARERPANTLERAPDAPAATAEVMPERERHRLLVEWNATDVVYPRDQCLHRLIEQQVARTPQAVALTDGARTFTFSQLNAYANRLAHHLRTLGVA